MSPIGQVSIGDLSKDVFIITFKRYMSSISMGLMEEIYLCKTLKGQKPRQFLPRPGPYTPSHTVYFLTF